jgi:hypothetical protein
MSDLATVNRDSARRIVNAVAQLPVAQRKMALRAMAQSDSPTLRSLAGAVAPSLARLGIARDAPGEALDRVARVIGLAGLTNEAYNLVDALGDEDPWCSIREALRVALEALLTEDDRPDEGNGGMRLVFGAGTSFAAG